MLDFLEIFEIEFIIKKSEKNIFPKTFKTIDIEIFREKSCIDL